LSLMENDDDEKCACGLPLHYSDPGIRMLVEATIASAGGDPYITVTVNHRSWRVQRHFIALHGLNAKDLGTPAFAKYGFVEITTGDIRH